MSGTSKQRLLLHTELIVVVGHYHTTAFLQNALRVALRPGNPGLMAGGGVSETTSSR